MSNVFPRQNGKSTLALNFARLQAEVNEANYKTYAERVKNDLLRKENQQLKELLKECKEFLTNRKATYERNKYYKLAGQYQGVLTEIDEVLK